MAHWFGQLAMGLARHWKRAALAAVLALAVIVGLGAAVGGSFENSFGVPGTDSDKAVQILKERFPQAAGDRATLVFHVDEGSIAAPARRAAIGAALAGVAGQPNVSGVLSPFGPRSQGQVSPDGRTAFATVQYDRPAIEMQGAGERLFGQAKAAEAAGVQVSARGGVADQVGRTEAPLGELIGIALAIVLLTILFRSILAMAVTLVGALIGVGLGVVVLTLLSGVITLPTFAPTLGVMLGLGAGIDYALLIVGRYREQRAAGQDALEAVGVAGRTAGFSVFAAGLIVIVAVLGLLLVGVPFVGGMGIGAAVVVAGVVVTALTVLPIALGALARRLAPKKAAHAEGSPLFERWAARVASHPVVATVLGAVILGALIVPATSLRIGMPDDSNKAVDAPQRIAYDHLTEGFGTGFNGQMLISMSLPADRAQAAAASARLQAAVAGTPGVVAVTPPAANTDGTAAIMSAIPGTSPQDERTSRLIETLRTDVIPVAVAGTGVTAYLGGATAAFKDMSDQIANRLPWFIGAVVILAVILLMASFRSFWIPLVSAAFNILGILAAYGAVQLMYGDSMPVVSFVPLMMFAILFGLSMDYNVFLLSRIQEAHRNGDAPREAVIHGMGRIGKVILVAGLVMAGVFGGFIITPDPIIQQLGFGLAVAILIDVLVVRMLLSPAIVMLLGEKAWWLPRWLDRILPSIHLEGEETDDDEAVGTPAPARATD